MAAHHASIFKSMKDIRFEDTISHQCGITMNDSVEARAIAEVMEKKPNVRVTYQPALIRIDGDPKLEFKMDEISEALGRPDDRASVRNFDIDSLWPHGDGRRQHGRVFRQHG